MPCWLSKADALLAAQLAEFVDDVLHAGASCAHSALVSQVCKRASDIKQSAED